MILTLNIPQTGVITQAVTGLGFGLSTSARKDTAGIVLSGRPMGIFSGVAAFMVSAANGKARGHRALFDAFAAGNKKKFDKEWPTWVAKYVSLLKEAAGKFIKDGKGGFIKKEQAGMSQSAVFNPNSLNEMMTDVLRSMDTTVTETFPMFSYSGGEDMEMDIATASSLWFVFNAAAIKAVAETSKGGTNPPQALIPSYMYNEQFGDIEKLLAKAGTTIWNRASAGKMNNDKGLKADGTPQATTREMSDAARKRATDKAFETRNANRVAKGLQPLQRRAPKKEKKEEETPSTETKATIPDAAAAPKSAANKPANRKPAANKDASAPTPDTKPAASTPPARANRAGTKRQTVAGDMLG